MQEEIFLWAKQEAVTPQAHDVRGVIIKQLGKVICGPPDGNKVAHLPLTSQICSQFVISFKKRTP